MPENSSIVQQVTRKARHLVLMTLLFMVLILALVPLATDYTHGLYQDASDRLLRAQQTADLILLADERLSMSARLAIESGDQQWVERYNENIGVMRDALALAEALAPQEIASRFHEETKVANDRLVELETAALQALQAGDQERALRLIDNDEYVRQQTVLADGTERFLSNTIFHLSRNVSRVDESIAKLERVVVIFSFLSTLLVWRWLNASMKKTEEGLMQAEQKIQELARCDALTGLSNRNALQEYTEQAINRARRRKSKLVVLMLDLDRFKPINDRHGHVIGDAVLREVASRFANCVRKDEMIARYGGDEFVVVIEHEAAEDSLSLLTERLMSAIKEPIRIGGLVLSVGASIGCARYPADANNYNELIRCADLALYSVKKKGRGTFALYDESMLSTDESAAGLERGLRTALDHSGIV